MKELNSEDVYGQEMWAYYKGERTSEIVERDDGYFEASEYGHKMCFLEYEDYLRLRERRWSM